MADVVPPERTTNERVPSPSLRDLDKTMEKRRRHHEKLRRARLRAQRPWYILLPDGGLAVMKDMLALMALISLYFVLPFEIAFVDAPDVPDPTDGLFIFNRVRR